LAKLPGAGGVWRRAWGEVVYNRPAGGPSGREAKGARKRFFEHIRTITAYLVFPDWQTLMTTLINSKPPPEIEKQIAG